MSVRAVSWCLTLALAVAACGGSPQPAAKSASDSAGGAHAADSTAAAATTLAAAPAAPAAARAIPASQSPRGAFPHEKHRGLPCQRCHAAVPGHTMHANIACSACHAPVPVTGPVPTPDQCAACHHSETQSRSCTTCHAPSTVGALTLTQTWKLSVWPAPRPRQLNFDHRWHTSQPCAACHTNRPAMVPTRPCASCHVHHEGQVDCRNCHQTPPAGAHTIAIHASPTGCAGSGCHQNPPVTVATLSRNECLVCHADRANHQPGKVCSTCHMLAPAQGPPGGKEPLSR